MKETGAPIIDIRNASKHFGRVFALNNVSMEVHSGEVVLIIGPSGSGKSTLLRCINRLETIDQGEIWVDGIQINAKPPTSIRCAKKLAWFSSSSICFRT